MIHGEAAGIVLRLDEPLSFWGGLDPETGLIIDARHPQRGESVSGRVIVMATGRGSSSASSTLVEAIGQGTAPIAIVLAEADDIIALGAVVADELYGLLMPVVVVNEDDFASLSTGDHVSISAAGEIATS